MSRRRMASHEWDLCLCSKDEQGHNKKYIKMLKRKSAWKIFRMPFTSPNRGRTYSFFLFFQFWADWWNFLCTQPKLKRNHFIDIECVSHTHEKFHIISRYKHFIQPYKFCSLWASIVMTWHDCDEFAIYRRSVQ